MAGTSVKFFSSTQAGAPVLDGAAGSLLNVLDACLITGFGATPVRAASFASGVVTLTLDGGHVFKVSDVVALSGFTPSEVNVEFRITSRTETTVSFTSDKAVGFVAGASIKRAALGWESTTLSTNVKVFNQKNKSKFFSYYEVNDTNQWSSSPFIRAQVRAFDIFSGGALSSLWGTYYIAKSRSNVSSIGYVAGSARPWVVIGDGEFVYVLTDIRTNNVNVDGLVTSSSAFGNAVSLRSDAPTWAPFLGGVDLAPGASNSSYGSGFQAYQRGVFSVEPNAIIRHSPNTTFSSTAEAAVVSSMLKSPPGVPNSLDMSENYHVTPAVYIAGVTPAVRLPGCYFPPAYMNDGLGFSIVDGGYLWQRASFPTSLAAQADISNCGTIVFDLVKDWR